MAADYNTKINFHYSSKHMIHEKDVYPPLLELIKESNGEMLFVDPDDERFSKKELERMMEEILLIHDSLSFVVDINLDENADYKVCIYEDASKLIYNRQKEINFLNKKLKEYCNQLNVDDVRSLNYSEIKKLYLVAGDYLSDDIKKIYEEKRLEEHPELKKAIYFPELNDIDFLTKAKIKKIDTLLGKSWNKKGFFVMNAFYKAANLYGKEREKFDDFACRKGIFKKNYSFYCKCGRCKSHFISETEYNRMKDYYVYGLGSKVKTPYTDDHYVVIFCENDPDCTYEICDKESFENAKYEVVCETNKCPEEVDY